MPSRPASSDTHRATPSRARIAKCLPPRVIKFASVVFVKYTAQGCVFSTAIFDFQFQIAAITETSASHVWQKHKKTRWVQGFSSTSSLLDLGSGRNPQIASRMLEASGLNPAAKRRKY